MGAPTVFISYHRRHATSVAFVEELEAELTDLGFRVLRDVGIEAGRRWPDELWQWLMECSAAVAVVSNDASASDWCRREWAVLAAREAQANLRVVPVRAEALVAEGDVLAHLQGIDLGPDTVRAVIDRLDGLRSGPPRSADFVAAHLAWLRWQFRGAAVLGREPYSLADVYVETECGELRWGTLAEDRTIDPFSEAHGGRAPVVETVLQHIADPSFRDLIVVQGPAGSGKSAFSLRLADRLVEEGLTPVLVRFRDLRLSSYGQVDELLQDAIRVAPVGEHPPAPMEPLLGATQLTETTKLGEATICRIVVILDGWDEVTLTGSTRFKDQLEQWLPKLRQYFVDRPGPPVRLLMTGRPSSAVDHSGLLRRETPVLTLRPLRPDQLRSYASGISGCLDGGDWRLDLARCEQAFASYESWFEGAGATGAEVLGSPLLALLAFRTLAERPAGIDDLFEKPTALYNALIEVTVAHAGKAEEGPQGTVQRGGRSLRRLLQRVASVITCQGGESISFEELRLRLEDDGALTEWAEQAAGEGALHELVVNFYFKGHQELGCEFLHKSFREYLFAEAIVAALEHAGDGHAGPFPLLHAAWGQDFPQGSEHHRASRVLAGLLGPQWITSEVRDHLFWLIEQAVQADRERWIWLRDLLNDIYGWWGECCHLRSHPERRRGRIEWQVPPVVEILHDELPRDGREPVSSHATVYIDAHLGKALLQLTAYIHELLADAPMIESGRECQLHDGGRVRFRPFNHEGRDLLGRIGTVLNNPPRSGPADIYLRAVDLSEEDLTTCDLSGCDLRDANLNGVIAPSLLLRGADLSNASMKIALLGHADLSGVRLAGANLTATKLQFAYLSDADLRGATLCDAVLNASWLRSADLSGADLTGAELVDAHLSAATLRNTRLVKARLLRADLSQADLTAADLRHARLAGARLRQADLRSASLSHAQMTEAHLRYADLSNADLRQADLTRADLRDANLTGARLDGAILVDALLPPDLVVR